MLPTDHRGEIGTLKQGLAVGADQSRLALPLEGGHSDGAVPHIPGVQIADVGVLTDARNHFLAVQAEYAGIIAPERDQDTLFFMRRKVPLGKFQRRALIPVGQPLLPALEDQGAAGGVAEIIGIRADSSAPAVQHTVGPSPLGVLKNALSMSYSGWSSEY